MKKKVLSCVFNMDTACVEVKYEDGSKLSIYCPRVEDMVAENRYERSELNWLVCNVPVDYVNLLLHGDIVPRHLSFYKTCFGPLFENTFEELADLYQYTTADGVMRFYHRTLDKLRLLLE